MSVVAADTARIEPARLREQAARCRRLAANIFNRDFERRLLDLADQLDAEFLHFTSAQAAPDRR